MPSINQRAPSSFMTVLAPSGGVDDSSAEDFACDFSAWDCGHKITPVQDEQQYDRLSQSSTTAMSDSSGDDDDETRLEDVACDFSAWDSLRENVSKRQRQELRRASLEAQRHPSSLLNEDKEEEEGEEDSSVQSFGKEEEATAIDNHGSRDPVTYSEDTWDEYSSDESLGNEEEATAIDAHGSRDLVTYSELTEEEEVDNEVWRMRFTNNKAFRRDYVPKRWERREMKSIINYLALKNPRDHPEFLKKRGQQITRRAVSSIFFPRRKEQRSVLLKRGPVLLGGEERELMLFTGGFVLSRLGSDSLVSLLLDASSLKKNEQLTTEQVRERFSAVDADSDGSLNCCEISDFFRYIGMTLSEDALDGLMKRFDFNSDGVVSFDEFESIMHDLQGNGSEEHKTGFWGGLGGKKKRGSKLDVAFQMSDIDNIQNMGLSESTTKMMKKLVSSEVAPLTLAIHLKGVRVPLVVTCSKPGHVEAWEEAFCTSRLVSNARKLASNASPSNDGDVIEQLGEARADDRMNVDYDLSAWDSLRSAISTEKQVSLQKSLKLKSCARTRMIKYVRHLSNPLEHAEENDSKSSLTDKLTEDELTDNKAWQMRFMSDDVFSRTYAPAWWEREEMNSIVDFLELKNPSDHSEYLKKPEQESTQKAVSSIFFPQPGEQQPVLLKRGSALLGGEERELMLFTNGFVFSRVELDTLVNLLLDASSSGKMEKVAPERITEQFSAIDADGGGSLDHHEVRDFFRGMGITLSETVLDEVVHKFDSDDDGTISFEEFKSTMDELHILAEKKKNGSFWEGLRGNLKHALIKDGVNRKLDVAFQMSDIKKIENMGACRDKELKRIVGKELAPLTLVVYLKDVHVPLVLNCSKPGHVEAWEEAFRKCMESQVADETEIDENWGLSHEEGTTEWDSPNIDWG